MIALGPIAAGSAATGPLAPFVMAAAAAVGPLTQIITNMVRGCGQTCVDASNYADTAETYIKELHRIYFGTASRCAEQQQAALQYIDGVLKWLDGGCRAVGGAAGQRCITERLIKGGSAPWCPKPGGVGCDWITLYRDPIANERLASCNGGGLLGGSAVDGSLLAGFGGSGGSMLWLVVIVLVVALILKGKR